MRRGLFITGTDTGVGKTAVSAAVIQRYRSLASLRYWKPIQTGIEQDDDTETVCRLARCSDAEIHRHGVRLPGAVSPHLAAQMSRTRIDVAALTGSIDIEQSSIRWIVEGAGGVLAPVNESQLMVDVIARLDLPIVVVARSSLGTINHTLLTLHLLRSRALSVAAVVMVGEKNLSNRQAIERYGKIAVIGEMPLFPSLTAESLGAWADSELDSGNELAALLT